MKNYLFIVLCLSLLGFAHAQAADDLIQQQVEMLGRLSLQELLDVEIVSVSKKAQSLSDAAAAVFVITQEQIRRSGAQSIADLLRSVPGVQVANINAYAHAISIRGFNSSFANKLLVLIDGRSVYKSEFSGVYWESVDLPLDDIERIEIIRGPGGSVWGANAVNGVINIITKSARDTQGGLVTAGIGEGAQQYQLSMRHGGKIDTDSFYRLYYKVIGHESWPSSTDIYNLPIDDHWRQYQVGLRVDSGTPEAINQFTWDVQALQNYLGHDQFEWGVAEIETTGTHVLGRWLHKVSNTSQWQVQGYYDYFKRDDPSLLVMANQMFDLEIQHQWQFMDKHELVWGLGYRQTHNEMLYGPVHGFNPAAHKSILYSLFVQDDIQLQEQLSLIIGSKFEHHDFTGWELQPSLGLTWRIQDHTTLWGSIARAVRTPSRYEHDSYFERPGYPEDAPIFNIPDDVPLQVVGRGGKGLASEQLQAYELGLRHQFNPSLSLDSAFFYNQYKDLILVSTRLLEDAASHGLIIDSEFVNGMEAESYGAEWVVNWLASDNWHWHLNYSWLDTQVQMDDNIASILDYARMIETRSPAHQLALRSHLRFAPQWMWDVEWRYVSELAEFNPELSGFSQVDAYWTLDTRLAWQLKPHLEFALIGRNLLAQKHSEFASEALSLYFRNQVERSIYAQVRWAF